MRIERLLRFFPALLVLLAPGCDRGVVVYPVKGKVVYADGTAIPGGMIEFESVDHQPKVNARGRINPDGTFMMGTFAVDDGAVAGKQRVIVIPPMRDEKAKVATPLAVDLRFANYARSGLEVMVEPKENDLTITVAPPKT